MMNTLFFKIGSLFVLGGTALATLIFSGVCPEGKQCTNPSRCPTRAAAVSTVGQTAEPAAMVGHCAKERAAQAAHSGCPYAARKAAQTAHAGCKNGQTAQAHSGCPFSHGASEVAQADTQPPAQASDN